jgi:hypothetical protein
MSYFATALVALVAAECLMAAGYGFPAAPIEAPETLVLVHVVALGWLSLLMSGALLQFVPVLVARPLFSERLPLPALACLVTGLAALLLGFLQLGGEVASEFSFLPAGAVLLAGGFTLNLWNLGGTLWPARPLPLPARFVAVGLLSVAATTLLGIIFALVLAGVTSKQHLLAVTAAGVPIHAIAGLGGWLTFSAIGVSYRLLAMFMLAPELDGPSTRATFWLGTGALAGAILGGVAAACIGWDTRLALVAAAALGVAAISLYGFDIVKLYRARKRHRPDRRRRAVGPAGATCGRDRISDRVRMVDRPGARQALQDRPVPDVARMLWPGARQAADAPRAGSGRGSARRQVVLALFRRRLGRILRAPRGRRLRVPARRGRDGRGDRRRHRRADPGPPSCRCQRNCSPAGRRAPASAAALRLPTCLKGASP